MIEKGKFKPKNVFVEWQRDTPEMLALCFKNDLEEIDFKCLNIPKQKELERLKNVMEEWYTLIKNSYHIMQSYSKRYPYVDIYTMRKYFLQRAKLIEGSNTQFTTSSFEIVINHYTAQRQHQDIIPDRCINRPGFVEIMVRFAQFYYTSGGTRAKEDDSSDEANLE